MLRSRLPIHTHLMTKQESSAQQPQACTASIHSLLLLAHDQFKLVYHGGYIISKQRTPSSFPIGNFTTNFELQPSVSLIHIAPEPDLGCITIHALLTAINKLRYIAKEHDQDCAIRGGSSKDFMPLCFREDQQLCREQQR
jgi:hypothetical protein